MKKAPALRFKGFTNDWEQRKLKKLGFFYKGKGYTKKDLINNGVPILLYGELYTHYSEKISNTRLHSKLLLHSIFSAGNEVVLPDSGETSTDIARASWISNSGIILAGGLIIIKPNEYIFPGFLAYSLTYGKNHKLLASRAQGKSIVHIHANDLKTLNIIYPENLKEQQRIFALLEKLNKCIALQQRKLRLLKLLKKATQQNIFASTECLPKLKYRNLTEKWQLYRLKDVAKITMGQSPNSKNYTQNPIDHILVQGNADIRNGYVFPRIWTTEITKIASKGDIILCVRAPAGDVGRTKFNVVIGRGVAAIKGNDFIFQQLQFMKSSGYWKKYISGSTFESINSNDIKNAKIFCPSQLEQKNISSLLDDIDTSIQIQQKNILDFKYIKQFLLQNMFI